jgi:hypothetical protein
MAIKAKTTRMAIPRGFLNGRRVRAEIIVMGFAPPSNSSPK